MIDPLQEFGFQESNYERPNQEWECGWAAQGEPCHIGPDSLGVCQAHRECMPYKEGDRFRCARPRNFGGDCPAGPRPDGACSQRIVECQPARTLRGRRKLLTFSATALALGVCLVMLGGSWGEPLFSPGELTLQHHGKTQTCADCHAAGDGTFTHLVQSAVGSEKVSGDTGRCIQCHKWTVGDHPRMAHGIDAQRLRSLREKNRENGETDSPPPIYSLLDTVARNPLDETNGLACALCHREHRGREHDLTEMSNVQCQSCHTRRFHSFERGHPEFTGYPYGRRTRLHFNHVTHYQVHFKSFERVKPGAVLPAALRDFGSANNPDSASCRACHQSDPSGQSMPILGFEHSCAACHGAEIEEDSRPGLELIALPKVSEDLLGDAGPKIGRWPKQTEPATSTAFAEVSVTPLMELLLVGDEEYAHARDLARATDWNSLDEEQRAAGRRRLVRQQLWAIKRLIHELVTEGEAAGNRRLDLLQAMLSAADDSTESALKPSPQIAQLSAALFHDPTFVQALAAARDAWFPELESEIGRLDANAPPAAAEQPLPELEAGTEPSAGWSLDVKEGALRYRVTAHTDRLLKALLDLTGRVPRRFGPSAQDQTGEEFTRLLARESAAELFGTVGDPAADWRCLDCHTADEQSDGRLTINWVGRHDSPDAQSFTKFSHGPHLTLLVKGDEQHNCATCHVLTEDVRFVHEEFVKFQSGYSVNVDPHSTFTSGFRPLGKQTCAECHTSRLAGDSCLSCHNYHIFKSK